MCNLDPQERRYICERLIEEAERLEEEKKTGGDAEEIDLSLNCIDVITEKLDPETWKL